GTLPLHRDGSLRPGDLLPAARRRRVVPPRGAPPAGAALSRPAPPRPLAAGGLSHRARDSRGLRVVPLPAVGLLPRADPEHVLSGAGRGVLHRASGGEL